MKKLNIIISLFFVFSCYVGVKPSITKYNLINRNSCQIEVIGYLNGDLLDSYSIEENSSFIKLFDKADPGMIVYPPPFEPFADSCIVVYGGTNSVTHLKDYQRVVGGLKQIKNLFNEDDYQVVNNENEVIYIFEFDEEDYERALERGRIVK